MSTDNMVEESKSTAPSIVPTDVPPNHTIYVKNLNEKVKLEELKKSLYHVFGQFGNILEINASKTLKNRGQAWVVFDDLAGSTKAMRDMQNFMFYGKAMKVAFAKSKSDCVAKIDGSFVPRPKLKPDAPEGKKKRKAPGGGNEKDKKDKGGKDAKEKKRSKKEEQPRKKMKTEHTSADDGVPNKILCVENLPPQCSVPMLEKLFNKYDGFKEARLSGEGVAFVEYGDAAQAGKARTALHNFKITPQIIMKVSFSK